MDAVWIQSYSDVDHAGEGLCGILNFWICMVRAREFLSIKMPLCVVDIHVYHRGMIAQYILREV